MKISICIPTYNRCKLLERAILSAISQDYPHKEIIISDNNSLDNTQAVVAALIKSHPNTEIYYYRSPCNVGMVPNWRKCMEKASGIYYIILDNDNYLTDQSYLSKAPNLVKHNRRISPVFANFNMVRPNQVSLRRFNCNSVSDGKLLYKNYFNKKEMSSMFFSFLIQIWQRNIVSMNNILLLMILSPS